MPDVYECRLAENKVIRSDKHELRPENHKFLPEKHELRPDIVKEYQMGQEATKYNETKTTCYQNQYLSFKKDAR